MIPSQIICWNPRPQCDGVWRRGILGVTRSWGQGLGEWDQWPYRGPRELPARFSMGGPGKKMVVYEPGSGPSPDTESACAFDPGLPAWGRWGVRVCVGLPVSRDFAAAACWAHGRAVTARLCPGCALSACFLTRPPHVLCLTRVAAANLLPLPAVSFPTEVCCYTLAFQTLTVVFLRV